MSNIYKIAEYLNSNFFITRSSNLIIFSKPKGSKYEYLFEIISVILELKYLCQLYNKIIYYLKIRQSSITTIFYQKIKQFVNLFEPNK